MVEWSNTYDSGSYLACKARVRIPSGALFRIEEIVEKSSDKLGDRNTGAPEVYAQEVFNFRLSTHIGCYKLVISHMVS